MTVVVMLMGDKLIIQVVDRLSEGLSPHIIPIFTQDILDITPQQWGTGFLVQAEGRVSKMMIASV